MLGLGIYGMVTLWFSFLIVYLLEIKTTKLPGEIIFTNLLTVYLISCSYLYILPYIGHCVNYSGKQLVNNNIVTSTHFRDTRYVI